jgi:hypothetical protein
MTELPSMPLDAVPGDTADSNGVWVDYFAFNDDIKHYLPDGKQYVVIRIFTEGLRKKYQKQTSRPLRFDQRTQTAIMQATIAEDRTMLLELAITDWYLVSGGSPVPFDRKALSRFLDVANPQIVDNIEKAVRKANPFLLADMDSKQIKEEIENLKELLEQVEEKERAEKL